MAEDKKEVMLPDSGESEAVENRRKLEANIQTMKNVWGHSEVGIEAKKAAMTMLSTKTGMYAKVPIMCKGDGCPYADSCQLLPYDLAPQGEFCPIETAQIELRFQGYSDDFDIDNASFTDKNLIAEIINCDIMIERAKALVAKEGMSIVDVVAGIGENGEEYYRPEISKAWELYERATKKRNETYNLMMATRKDKKRDTSEDEGSIFDQIKNMAQVEEVEEVEEE